MRSNAVVVDAFGVRWELRFDEVPTAIRSHVEGLWSRARTDERADGVFRIVTTAPPDPVERVPVECVVVDPTTPDRVPYDVSRAITLASIGRRAGQALMLHAAGVCTDEGAMVALVAASGTGKTTAAATLGRSLGYVTDECVCVEADWSVSPYPKPLSVCLPGGAPDEKSEHSPDELGLMRAPHRVRFHTVLLLARDPGVTDPVLVSEPLVDALLDLLPQTSSLLRLEHPLGSLARAATAGGGPWRLRYAEIGDCVPTVEGLLDGSHPTEPVEWSHHPGQPETPRPTAVTGPPLADAEHVVRAPWRDAVNSQAEALLILHDLPIRLSPVGFAIWEAALEPVRVGDAADIVVRAIGPHPDAPALVHTALRELVGAGVLTVVER